MAAQTATPAREYTGTFEFESVGHVFTVEVKPTGRR